MKPDFIQRRELLVACAVAGPLAFILAGVEPDSPWLSALRLGLGFFAVGFAPGLVLALAGGWARRINGLSLAGLAAVLSLAVAQLLCGVTLGLHWSCFAVTLALVIATSAGAITLMARWRRPKLPLVFWPVRDRWLFGFLIAGAVALYPKGSPVYGITFEDFWHLAPLARLAGSQALAVTGTFVEPGLAFTHPASGMHFFMAMVANASGEEPIFVFNKMRSFAGFLAPLFLYLTARRIFARPVTATFAGLGVIVLVMTGSLADTKWHWGQAAPVSHNTDLVMSMLVPGVGWMVLATLGAAPGRRFRWWLAATGGLFLFLVCSHIREGPQVLLYLGMFAATMIRFPSQGRRALVLAGVLAAMIYGYQQWHHHNVPQITEHVNEHRQALEKAMHLMHGWDWWRSPVAVYPIETLWEGWHGVFIVLLPLVLAWWGRRREALGVILGLLAALLLIRIPALSLAANWSTYDEILMFPVRFFTPFSLLLPGALLWGLAASLSQRWWQALVALLGVAGLVWLKYHAEEMIARQPDLFFGSAFLAMVVALVHVLRERTPAISAVAVRRGGYAAAGLLLVTGLSTENLTASPFGWLSREVPPDEVVLSNPNGMFPLTGFVPNPGYGWSVVFNLGLSTSLRALHKESYTKYAGPPFYNLGETPAERLALCRRLGAQIVVLDPSQAGAIQPLLEAEPAIYSKCYEDQGWYLYRVHLPPTATP